MGYSDWSEDFHQARQQKKQETGTPNFAYSHQMASAPVEERKVHALLDPKDRIRESRDSATHPDSLAVAVLFDVTGSMESLPRYVNDELHHLNERLRRRIPDAQIMFGGIGDAEEAVAGRHKTPDRAPIQIGQFESGNEMTDDLDGRLWLEGGGGGGGYETYELAMYFMATRTALDCLDKRHVKGELFIIGDEKPYNVCRRELVKKHLGTSPEEDIPVEDIVALLKQAYNVTFIFPTIPPRDGGSGYWNEHEHIARWEKLLGKENVVRLSDITQTCEIIASRVEEHRGISSSPNLDTARASGNVRL